MHTRRASSKLLFAMYVVLSGGSSKSATTHGASSAALCCMVATCAAECTASNSAELATLPSSLFICRTIATVVITHALHASLPNISAQTVQGKCQKGLYLLRALWLCLSIQLMRSYFEWLRICSEIVLLQGLQDCRNALGTLVMICQIMPSRRGHRIGQLSSCHVFALPLPCGGKLSTRALQMLLMSSMASEAYQQ